MACVPAAREFYIEGTTVLLAVDLKRYSLGSRPNNSLKRELGMHMLYFPNPDYFLSSCYFWTTFAIFLPFAVAVLFVVHA